VDSNHGFLIQSQASYRHRRRGKNFSREFFSQAPDRLIFGGSEGNLTV